MPFHQVYNLLLERMTWPIRRAISAVFAGGLCDRRFEAADVNSEALQSHPGGDVPGTVQQRPASLCGADLASSSGQQLAGGRCRGQGKDLPILHLPHDLHR